MSRLIQSDEAITVQTSNASNMFSRPPRGKRIASIPTSPASRARTGGTEQAGIDPRWRCWHHRYRQLKLWLVLFDALDDADQAGAERAAWQIEEATGIGITLPMNWPSRHRDEPSST